MDGQQGRIGRRIALVGACVAGALAILVLAGSRDQAALSLIEQDLGLACGQTHLLDDRLLIAVGTNDETFVDCLPRVRSALTRVGWPERTADELLREGSGSHRQGGVHVLHETIVLDADDARSSMTFVEILDCRRVLVRTARDAWNEGVSADLFLYSPCDDAARQIGEPSSVRARHVDEDRD